MGGRWLLALRWLLLPFDEGYPEFQRTDAWADHGMVTAAASWAELRRDTILYVIPPVQWAEGGDEDALPPGQAAYVEPNPELYAALSDVLGGLEQTLRSAGGTTETRRSGRPALRLIGEGRRLLRLFEEAAQRELAGEGLTIDSMADEAYVLREINAASNLGKYADRSFEGQAMLGSQGGRAAQIGSWTDDRGGFEAER